MPWRLCVHKILATRYNFWRLTIHFNFFERRLPFVGKHSFLLCKRCFYILRLLNLHQPCRGYIVRIFGMHPIRRFRGKILSKFLPWHLPFFEKLLLIEWRFSNSEEWAASFYGAFDTFICEVCDLILECVVLIKIQPYWNIFGLRELMRLQIFQLFIQNFLELLGIFHKFLEILLWWHRLGSHLPTFVTTPARLRIDSGWWPIFNLLDPMRFNV